MITKKAQRKKTVPFEKLEKWDAVTKRARTALAKNLSAALSVADTSDDNTVRPMKLTELEKQTFITRSTLTKLKHGAEKSSTKGAVEANPDLKTICKLASELNVSPAILLMTPKDWMNILGAIQVMQAILGNAKTQEAILSAKGVDKVNQGLEIADAMKLYPKKIEEKLKKELDAENLKLYENEVQQENKNTRLAILTTTAILQNACKSPNDTLMMTAIGSHIGVNFR